MEDNISDSETVASRPQRRPSLALRHGPPNTDPSLSSSSSLSAAAMDGLSEEPFIEGGGGCSSGFTPPHAFVALGFPYQRPLVTMFGGKT